MGHPGKVTLKSSCGHSMVPTARAYAGLCQEIQTALYVEELGACLHKWGTPCEFQTQVNVSLERNCFVRYPILVVLHNRGLSWWKHAQSSQFGYYLTNIQITPCTCMLVISSELLSALVIQRLNPRMSFMFISNHRHLFALLFFFKNCNLWIVKT